MTEKDKCTTQEYATAYESTITIFQGLIKEVRELSKKKHDATLSKGKVKIINRILNDLIEFLRDEPEGRYLEILSDEDLPQHSDAVLVMVQFEAALNQFRRRYYDGGSNKWRIEKKDKRARK